MARPTADARPEEPAGDGSEDNAKVQVENHPEWKKRPGQYPNASEQAEIDSQKS